ncbi:response regulator transcription factor [Saprospiraceae bacterium]|nr:response regulator transcription factor [Saprospiraceae bacterium]
MSEVRVLIVEDEPLIAEDISDFLGETNYICAGIAYDSETALDMIVNRDPDVALLDINIEGTKNGIEIAQIIRKKHNIPFIFLTSHSDKETLDKAKLTLPYGYIVKPFNENDLISSLEMAVFRHANENKSDIPTLSHINGRLTTSLTEKEYDCLVQLSNGLTNKQMAEIQFISINTIKTHLKNLFLKLDVPNRTKAIHKAFKL